VTGRVLAWLALIALAASPAAAAAQPPRAALEAFACRRAASQLDRAIEVTAVMRPLPGTRRMELRFVLQRKPAGVSRFGAVRGRYLGMWLRPANPTLGQRPGDVWVVNKPVVNLPGPALYRFRVTFRWLGARGVLGAVARLSPACEAGYTGS
jgi:hypothetical protein